MSDLVYIGLDRAPTKRDAMRAALTVDKAVKRAKAIDARPYIFKGVQDGWIVRVQRWYR